MIKEEERKQLLIHYKNFVNEMERKKREAVALASMVAENKEVQRLLAERDREGLDRLLVNTYVRLHRDQEISQFHFHVPPGVSFLRLHHPPEYGDVLYDYRDTIREAVEGCEPASGLEYGETGFGIRGVVPVFHNARLVGTAEIGHSFGEPFLKGLHESWGIDIALYRRTKEGRYLPMARVCDGEPERVFSGPKERGLGKGSGPLVLISPGGLPQRSVLISEVEDYGGDLVAQVEISLDRSSIRQRLARTRDLMLLVGCVGIAVSFLLTYVVTALFISPIRKIVREAQEIADEKREIHLETGPGDEIGTLTRALNLMLTALKERRIQIEGYARHLERRVEERTQDLVASEEKYRTLVENVPLIVYRVLPDGTTEFINSHLTESLGYAIEDAVGDRNFWCEKILGSDQEAWRELFETCFQYREECRIERVVRDREGRPLVFLDHAIPATDDHGRPKWIDGIMMEITELKRLQERAVRSEEIRLLGEISARMAHEIRNPLSTAGGFARRLKDSMPEGDKRRGIAEIIVKEVSRMETFLGILLRSIRPFELSVSEMDLNRVISGCLEELEDLARSRDIKASKDFQEELPLIQGDEDRLNQAFESLLKHSMVTMPEGDTIELRTRSAHDQVRIQLAFSGALVSDDDLAHFFFPHLEHDPEKSVLDLPLSKIIIHRHGGRIRVHREGESLITEIELPVHLTPETTEPFSDGIGVG